MQDRITDNRRDERSREPAAERNEERAEVRTPSGEPAEAERGEDGRNITINRIVEAASAAGVSFDEMVRTIAEAAGMSEEQVRNSPQDAPGRLEESDARTHLGDRSVLEARRAEDEGDDDAADALNDATPSGDRD
jgi:hypothetical protein